MIETAGQLHAGSRISVRGQLWRILERTAFVDCDAIRVRGAEPANRTTVRTLLLPFDRPQPVQTSSALRVMRTRRWMGAVHAEVTAVNPFGGLSSTAGCPIALLPYQLEPALAMLRDGHTRILIADAVGLGKTIQAGVILRQLATEHAGFRALVIVPAGLREQWAIELDARFRLASNVATSAWLSRITVRLPRDINPWSLPGIYIASFDFVKRPEALRPLEEMAWDVVVVDEAHAATDGTNRRAAVHSVATRSRRVILLSATPHGGDPGQFTALCGIGSPESAPQPLLVFNRSRDDSGASGRRRTILMPVHLSNAERAMHRALDAYTSQVCTESRTRGDPRARLAAIVLAKRALSSAASLARSCRRRMDLLAAGGCAATELQIALPFADEDSLQDAEPASALAAPGLRDGAAEQHWLAAIARAADDAARHEAKLGVLTRLLRRANESAIVFTEYRDTLEHLRPHLAPLGKPIVALHGGMAPHDRTAAQRAFNSSDAILLATDAASEGLNLHHRCRMVIHFELPWNPSRLEQRTGRVDRIGQQRTVHEVFLVAQDTAERLVLAPLARRAARARGASHGRGLFEVLTESRVAAAVMEGAPLDVSMGEARPLVGVPTPDLEADGRREAARLADLRTWIPRASRLGAPVGIPTTVVRPKRTALPAGIVCLYKLSIISPEGNARHEELIGVHAGWPVPLGRCTPSAVRVIVNGFRQTMAAAIEDALRRGLSAVIAGITQRCEVVDAAARARARATADFRRSAAQQLVQAGLFGRRASQSCIAQVVRLPDLADGREQGASESTLAPVLTLSAILLVTPRLGQSRRPRRGDGGT